MITSANERFQRRNGASEAVDVTAEEDDSDQDSEDSDNDEGEASESSSVASAKSNKSNNTMSVDCDSVEAQSMSSANGTEQDTDTVVTPSPQVAGRNSTASVAIPLEIEVSRPNQNSVLTEQWDGTRDNAWRRHRRTMPPKRNQEVLRSLELWSSADVFHERGDRKLQATHYSSLVPKLKTPLSKKRNKARAAASSEDTNLLQNIRLLLNKPEQNVSRRDETAQTVHADDIEIANDGTPQELPAEDDDNVTMEDGHDESMAEQRDQNTRERIGRRSRMSLDGNNNEPKLNKFITQNLFREGERLMIKDNH